MATSIREESVLKFVARLQQRTRQRTTSNITPTASYPGSAGKIAVLAERVAQAGALHHELPLHHPLDAKLPIGQAWKIWVGPNGRIIRKVLVSQDEAGIVVVCPELTRTILEQVQEAFGPGAGRDIIHEPPMPPPPPLRRAA